MSNKQAELQLQNEFNYHFTEFLTAFLAVTIVSCFSVLIGYNVFQSVKYSTFIKVSTCSICILMVSYCVKNIVASLLKMVDIKDEIVRARKTK